MQIKTHPTHALKTRRIIYGLLILVVVSFGVTYFAQENLSNQTIVNYSVVVGLVSMISMLITALMRALMCRCPVCKAWLVKQVKVEIDTDTRKFICKKCNTIWDSKVQLTYGSN